MDPRDERHAAELRRARSAKVWKRIVGATATAALAVVILAGLHDLEHTRDEARERGRMEAGVETGAALVVELPPSVSTDVAPAAPTPDTDAAVTQLIGADTSDVLEATSLTTTTSAAIDAGIDVGDAAIAAPAVAAIATPFDQSPDAAVESDASTTDTEDMRAADRAAPDAGDAGDAGAFNPWAPPTMSAGAGPFLTEAPYWAASAFTSNPNAGAGRFITEAPPWSGTAFTSNPNAGAGPFTTERNIPGYGVWPYGWVVAPFFALPPP